MEELSIEKARLTLGEVVDRARIAGQQTLITRQGKPAAMVVGLEPAYTLAQIRNGTGWPPGAQFVLIDGKGKTS